MSNLKKLQRMTTKEIIFLIKHAEAEVIRRGGTKKGRFSKRNIILFGRENEIKE